MHLQGLKPAAFEMPINTCAYELRAWGIDLRALTRTRPFLFSEVGLGGGKGFRCGRHVSACLHGHASADRACNAIQPAMAEWPVTALAPADCHA
jgi:hypothetical protein